MPVNRNIQSAQMVFVVMLVAMVTAMGPATAGDSFQNTTYDHWTSTNGFYVEGRIGGPINGDYDVNMVSPNVAQANGKLGIEGGSGLGGALSVGKQFSRLWRGEFTWAYVSSDDLDIDFSGAPANPFAPGTLNSAGEMSVHTLMFSVLRSWDYEFFGRIRPFSGAGVGVAIIDIDQAAPANSRFVINDKDTVFAAAWHSGVDVPLTDAMTLTVRSDTILTTGGTFAAIDTTNAGGIMSVRSGTDVTWAVGAGLRVKLN